MTTAHRAPLIAPTAMLLMSVTLPLAGQRSYAGSRTPWGDPDLQGTCTNTCILGAARAAERAQ